MPEDDKSEKSDEEKDVQPEELKGRFGLKKDLKPGEEEAEGAGAYKLWVLVVAAVIAISLITCLLWCCCCRKSGDASNANVAE